MRFLFLWLAALLCSTAIANTCTKVIATSPAIFQTLRALDIPSKEMMLPWFESGNIPIAWEAILAEHPSHVFVEKNGYFAKAPRLNSVVFIDWNYTIEGILQATQTIANTCNAQAKYQKLTDVWQQTAERAKQWHSQPTGTFLVLYPDSTLMDKEWYAAGSNYHTQILERFGWKNALTSQRTAERIGSEVLLSLNPTMIVFMNEGTGPIVWERMDKNKTVLRRLPIQSSIWVAQGKHLSLPTISTLTHFAQSIERWLLSAN